MKRNLKLITVSIVLMFLPSVSIASSGAEIIELQNAMGKIKFYHKRHQERLKDCTICHAGEPGKISGFRIEWGHNICKNCHFKVKNGLIECIDCHQAR